MKLLNRNVLFFCLNCLGIFFINSCAQTPSYEEMRIIVSPHKLNVHSGSEDKVFVQLLDKQGRPLSGVKIEARSTSPTVATVTPESLTNRGGKAIFIVKGISPGTTNVIISAMEHRTTVEVVFVEH
jgi:hypothetical protein